MQSFYAETILKNVERVLAADPTDGA